MPLDDVPAPKPRPLPPVADKVDEALARIDEQVDWLVALSPLGNDQMWERFKESGFTEEPVLRYPPQRADLSGLRDELLGLPVRDIEEPSLQVLLREKQREVDRQIELVQLRDTDGFVPASIDLFGGTDPRLLTIAQDILDKVERGPAEAEEATFEDMVAASKVEFDRYRAQAPDFRSEIIVEDDLNSMLMVNHGHLHIARSMHLRHDRIAPLVAHEVGIHVLTRHNGRRQPLRQLEVGLAHYDALQEGLGTFAEYLTGYLPPRRLRVLAARVIACDLAVDGKSVCEIFARLHEEEGLLIDDAFDIAVRAKRGGGLTKDALYLGGLRELLAYLAEDGDFEFLLLGKFSLAQRHTISQLLEEGWLVPAELLPSFLSDPQAQRRLDRARTMTVDQLFQRTPAP
ncbi:tyrosine/phenylalanine carboxypeptidase domain-containing protein [Parvularcula oceani]|uniref:tyrosine/phenylalanine carboxypeptidase domain-containing protein n=1 Tax=Parvularcula oceani TaxID=1247963 RepID=UPI0004E28906|nr:tyrosine/phenylalanine carboxypeptidase domain-containing protein [Parvularcula oceani]